MKEAPKKIRIRIDVPPHYKQGLRRGAELHDLTSMSDYARMAWKQAFKRDRITFEKKESV